MCKAKNNISSITDETGTIQTDPEAIKQVMSSHFKELLTECSFPEDYSDLLQYLLTLISDEINNSINQDISKEEVESVIWTIHQDKAPGPDGFPISFYKAYWSLIKKYLMKMIQWAHRKKKIRGYTNATFLALIPKENRPSSFS